VAILGGGVAGLACAVRAAMFGLDVALCADPVSLRSWWAGKVHPHFAFPEGVSGRALLERGVAQAEAAGAELLEGAAQSARLRDDGTFDVRARIGAESEAPLAFSSRCIVLADEPPDVPEEVAGLLAPAGIAPPDAFAADEAELVGRRVLAFADGPAGVRAALEAARLAARLTILLPVAAPDPTDALRQRIDAAGARLVRGSAAALEGRASGVDGAAGATALVAVRLDDEERIELDRAIVASERRASVLLGGALGLEDTLGWIAGDGGGRTAVQGCWIADAGPPWRALAEAEHAGARVALDVWTVLRRERRPAAAPLDLDTD